MVRWGRAFWLVCGLAVLTATGWFARGLIPGGAPSTAPAAPPPAPPPPLTDFAPALLPTEFVAGLLAVKPAQVIALQLQPSNDAPQEPGASWTWTCRVAGVQYTVTLARDQSWNLETADRRGLTLKDFITPQVAQVKAARLVRRRFGADFGRMVMTAAPQTGRRQFDFAWSEPAPAGRSGHSARVVLDAGGRLELYTESRGRALPPSPSLAAEPVEPAQDPAAFVGALLGLPADALPRLRRLGDLSPQLAPTPPREYQWLYQVRGRAWRISHRAWSWQLVMETTLQPDLPVSRYHPRQSQDWRTLQQVATDYMRRRWPGQLNTPGWFVGQAADGRVYFFRWRERLAPDVWSGNMAMVALYPDGMLHSYAEQRAPAGLTIADVKISRQQARAAADNIVRWGSRVEGQRYVFREQWLVLWDDPSCRPVWRIKYSPSGVAASDEAAPGRFRCLKVDGLTGAATYR